MRNVAVARGLLKLVDLELFERQKPLVKGIDADLLQLLLFNVALYLHNAAVKVHKVILIDAQALFRPKAYLARPICVFHKVGVKPIYVDLRLLCHRDHTKSVALSLLGIHHVQHHGIHAVIIPAALGVYGIVFRGVQHHTLCKLAVMQQGLAVHSLFVIPVHHDRLALIGA